MDSFKKVALALIVVSLLLLSVWLPGTTVAQEGQGENAPAGLVNKLQELTNGRIRISTHAQTGMVRFIGTELPNTIPQSAALRAGVSPEDAARGFLAEYGELFGLANQSRELNVMRSQTTADGRSFVRFQQVYEGIPVMGGELIVQMGPTENSIISVSGEILPNISLDNAPITAAPGAQESALNVLDTSTTIDASIAREKAISVVVKEYGIDASALTVSEPELWIYNPVILGLNFDFDALVWRMEVESIGLLPIRELVLVDAHLGAIALHFNQIDTAKNRLVYDTACSSSLPGTLVRSEGQGPTGDAEQDKAYDYTGDTYDFYWSEHGRDSIDNAGMSIKSTVDYDDSGGECDYANAFWNGSQIVFGTGFVADDIVGHELTHGVTSYESDLFYYMQSGAINEAFSDIWGEFVDLTNGAGNDTSGVRWLMGEDVPGGAIRSMSNPPAYGLPDKMSSIYYYCGTLDNGGVHYNMGVGSKAAYLMVDGGSFNGYAVTGMGISKTADVWYEVQTNLLTSGSDYADLYDALQQAAINLGYSTADRQTVKNAIDATEMDQQPSSCAANEAPICDTGSPTNLWFDDLEGGAGSWYTVAISGSSEWYYGNYYATSGIYHLYGYDQPSTADYYVAMSSDVTLPSGAYLHFRHAYDFESTFDGGVVEYSTNGGSSWSDAGSLFTHNGYNGTISSATGNPLGGRSAFVDDSNGYISSRLSLSSLAGQSVRFRFRIGTDSSVDDYGWFIDDVRIYTCGAGPADTDKIGTFYTGNYKWYLDLNDNGVPDDSPTGVFGSNKSKPVAGDWDGDGDDDIGTFYTGNYCWYLKDLDDGSVNMVGPFGSNKSIPVVGDWDGDGDDDIGTFYTGNYCWYLKDLDDGSVSVVGPFGSNKSIPVAGDWDGDGDDDIGTFYTGNYRWYLKDLDDGSVSVTGVFGSNKSKPVAGDWDGDGDDDIGTFYTGNYKWYLRDLDDGSVSVTSVFGSGKSIPVAGNWDGS